MPKKTPLMELTELRQGDTLENLIRRCVEEGLSIDGMADRFGVTRLTIYHWLERLGARIETRRTVAFVRDDSAAVA